MSKFFTISNGRITLNKFHRYHLLNLNRWPILTSFSLLFLVLGLVTTFYDTKYLLLLHLGFGWFKPNILLVFGLVFLIVCVVNWWSNVSSESTGGEHTKYVIRGLKFGMILFIISEIFFFLSFFWAFFHASLSPAPEIGGVWPPFGFDDLVLEFNKIPLLNTLLLLSSGVTVTYAHLSFNISTESENPTYVSSIWGSNLKKFFLIDCGRHQEIFRNREKGFWSMYLTLVFAILFILLQGLEYCEAYFNMSDGIYGSTFFLMTGFHGLHVIVGTIFLIVSLIRIRENYFFGRHSTGLECAIWYWHFVDVVWLFLYISIYYWGNKYYTTTTSINEVIINDAFINTESFFIDGDYSVQNEIMFQDPATTFMEKILKLHDYIMLYLVFICFIFLALVISTIKPDKRLKESDRLKYSIVRYKWRMWYEKEIKEEWLEIL